MLSVRYIVDDVDRAIPFYEALDFEVVAHPAPGFAALRRGELQLLLNAPGAGGAGQAMPDGAVPSPGGWNRFQLVLDELDGAVSRLRQAGVSFRNEIVEGQGGRQILAQDPAGNLVELLEPR
jgi:catechol 2,3-dioxygenase-like lactoylglutathione lyase family enzyme